MLEFGVVGIADLREKLNYAVDYIKNKIKLDEEVLYNYRLVLCELVSNVIQHGKSDCKILIDILDKVIRINVSGGEGFIGGVPSQCQMSQRGRGLLLVDALCEDLKFINDGKEVEVQLAF